MAKTHRLACGMKAAFLLIDNYIEYIYNLCIKYLKDTSYMFTLKCEYCGFEQTINKRIDKYTYYELTHCKHLWCPCNKCKETHPRPITIEKGLVKHGWVLGEWDCLLKLA